MRQTGSRGARARRRAAKHTSTVPVPQGWPDADTLIAELAINDFASQLLEDMKPEVVRTILRRTDVKVRKAVLEPHNIPATKVSLRAAGQVLNLVRADQTPAESPILGTLLSPAGQLFDEAKLSVAMLMGLRLKLIDVALPLIAKCEPGFQGLRTWHRWGDESFETITLATVIGRRCSHAALAASFLAVEHPDIAERYEALREHYPRMPQVPWARLTPLNPVSRYLAARPDRKLPSNTGELLRMLAEDTAVRHSESEESQAEEPRPSHDAQPRQPSPPRETPPALPAPHEPRDDLPALPDVVEWANAVTHSRRLTEQLIAGHLPDVTETQALLDLSLRVRNLATVASRVLRRPVDNDRFAVDRALTEILADPALNQRLGGMPATVADVAAALRRLPELDRDATPPEAPQRAAEAAAEPTETDLSDLDNILRGETGAQLTAIAAPTRTPHESVPPASLTPDGDPPQKEMPPAEKTVATPAAATPSRVDEAVSRMVAIALSAQHPGGALSEEYARIVTGLDLTALESDPLTKAVALSTAMPMALLDASCGAGNLLWEDIPELSGCPRVLEFRESIAELSRHGIGVFEPPVRKLTNIMDRFNTVKERAAQLRDHAAIKTLKYDKATKVYRSWFAPQGQLRPLVDALAAGRDTKHIAELAEHVRKVGATRAIDGTLTAELGSGRTRIVAGARQALKDVYAEVLAIADDNRITMEAAMWQHTSDRSAAWRFEKVAHFRDQLHGNVKTLQAEVESQECPHAVVFGMVLRAMSIGLSPLPACGPEIGIAAAMRYAYPYQSPREAT